MAEMESIRRSLNPLVLNLQKMELELTCPMCLKLLNLPTFLPCSHISCSPCAATSSINGYVCPICKIPFHYQDFRPATQIEAIVNIYKNLNSTIGSILTQRDSHAEIPVSLCPETKTPSGRKTVNNLEQEHIYNMIANINAEKSNFNREANKKEGNFGPEFIEQKGPCGSQSSGEMKDLDCDSNDLESLPIISQSPVEGLSKRGTKVGPDQIIRDQPKESKRQKLNNDLSVNKGGEVANTISSVECGFCHTFRITEDTGPIMHYLNGVPVKDEKALLVNVLHAHEKCIEWAPQAFFAGDTAMNLEPEIVRASKMKCNICGLKGAALGCFAKSCRRSFHFPCASDMPGCRWDLEKFLMLCPVHSSYKLPCDRTRTKEKKAKRPKPCTNLLLGDLNSPPTKQSDVIWTGLPSLTREWLICGSALSDQDKKILDEFADLTCIAVTNNWKPSVTHVIAATDERGACSRTLKVLMAILSGKWILSVNWLKACMEAMHPVPEEPYEISYDVHGSFDGPRTGRLRALQMAPKLFEGLAFYFSGHFMPYYKQHLEDLISAAGGSIIIEKANLSTSTSFIVYSTEPPQGSDPNDLNEVIKKRKIEAEELAGLTGSRVVAHTWLLDSIAACTVQMAA